MTRHSGKRKARVWGDRICALLWMVALVALVGAGVRGVASWTHHQRPIPSMRAVVVPHGGTLWGLAVRCATQGQDPRQVADEIRQLNRLHPGSTLHPGTRLLIPDYRSGALRLAQNSQESG